MLLEGRLPLNTLCGSTWIHIPHDWNVIHTPSHSSYLGELGSRHASLLQLSFRFSCRLSRAISIAMAMSQYNTAFTACHSTSQLVTQYITAYQHSLSQRIKLYLTLPFIKASVCAK
jgi:hypothetical protein